MSYQVSVQDDRSILLIRHVAEVRLSVEYVSATGVPWLGAFVWDMSEVNVCDLPMHSLLPQSTIQVGSSKRSRPKKALDAKFQKFFDQCPLGPPKRHFRLQDGSESDHFLDSSRRSLRNEGNWMRSLSVRLLRFYYEFREEGQISTIF